MSPQVLTMCSTKARPEKLVTMIRSFEQTSKADNKLVVYCSETDTKIAEYKALPDDIQKYIEYGPAKYLVQIYNDFATKQYPNIEFYKELHDDNVCITDAWDIELIKTINEVGHGWGVAVPDNTITDPLTCTNPGGFMMSGNIVRALGWVLLPTLTALCTDRTLELILEPLCLQYHRADIVIDHVCWHDGKRGFGARVVADEASIWSYSAEAIEQANQGLVGFNPAEHTQKIREAMNEDFAARGILIRK